MIEAFAQARRAATPRPQRHAPPRRAVGDASRGPGQSKSAAYAADVPGGLACPSAERTGAGCPFPMFAKVRAALRDYSSTA